MGASNGGDHPGISDADGVQKKITGLVQNKAYPPVVVFMSVFTVEVKGVLREIIAVQVPASVNKPHFTGGSFIRRGSETIRASDEQFRELIASQNETVHKLQKHRGKTVILSFRSEPSGLRLDYYNARLMTTDAHTTEVDTNEGYSYPLPTKRLEVFDQNAKLVKIVAPSPWAELEHIQKMIWVWAAAHPNSDGIPNDQWRYITDQLFAYIKLSHDVIRWEKAKCPSRAMNALCSNADLVASKISRG